MSNKALFKAGDTYTVNMETGESVPVEDGGFRMLPTAPGTCAWCGVQHDPGYPHDQQSMVYRIKFQEIHKRPPTWTDAMAHCSEEVRSLWRYHLVDLMRRKGMAIPEDLQ